MAGQSDYTAQNILNYLTGRVAMPSLLACYVALFTTLPSSNAGTDGMEVSSGSYARVQIAGVVTTRPTTASGNATQHFGGIAPVLRSSRPYDRFDFANPTQPRHRPSGRADQSLLNRR
jgi:hypothetical protein